MIGIRSAFLGLTLLALLSSATLAQVWAGPAGIEIEVSSKGKPIVGARVVLRYREAPKGTFAVLTDERGRAAVINLAQGAWNIEVSHEDYLSYVAAVTLEANKKASETTSFLQATGSGRQPIRVRYSKASRAIGTPVEAPPPPTPADDPIPTPTPAPATEQSQPEPEPEPVELREPDIPAPSEPEPDMVEPTTPQQPEPTAPEAPAEETAPEVPEVDVPEADLVEPPVATPQPMPEPAPPADEPVVEPEAELPAPTPTAPVEVVEPERPEPEPAEPEGSPAVASAAEVQEPEPEAPAIETPPTPEPPGAVEPAVDTPVPTPTPQPPGEEADIEELLETGTLEPEAEPEPLPEPEPEVATPAPTPAPRDPSPSLRAFRDRTCPECKPGEWSAASVEIAAALSGASACPADARELAETAARGVARAPAGSLEGFAGPAIGGVSPTALELVPQATRAALIEALDWTNDSCRLLAVSLPRGAKFTGFRYEAADSDGQADCVGDRDCPIGDSAFLGNPGIERGREVTVVYAVFENRASDRERRARLTVYFVPGSGWRP